MNLNDNCYVVDSTGEVSCCIVHHVDKDGELELKHKEKELYYTWNPELQNEGWEKAEWIWVFSEECDAIEKSNKIVDDMITEIEEYLTFDDKESFVISMINTLSQKITNSNRTNTIREYLQDRAMELGLL